MKMETEDIAARNVERINTKNPPHSGAKYSRQTSIIIPIGVNKQMKMNNELKKLRRELDGI